MSTVTSNTELSILTRIVVPEQPNLSTEAARAFLTLKFADDDVERMNFLAERAREGVLGPEEQEEIDLYERIGYLLSLLHSRARLSLRNGRAVA